MKTKKILTASIVASLHLMVASCGKENDKFVAVESAVSTSSTLHVTENENSNDSDSSDTAPVNTVNPMPPSLNVIQSLCESKTNLVQDLDLRFPNPKKTCDWEINGNYGRKDGWFQARREQVIAFAVPDNAIICSLTLNSAATYFRYDDQFIVTFNDFVIAASKYVFTKSMLSEVVGASGTYRYEWQKIAGIYGGTNISGDKEVYCYGKESGSECDWPKSQATGPIKINPHPSKIQQLMALPRSQSQLELKFITTGDNNDSDCQHSDLNFQARLQYVLP